MQRFDPNAPAAPGSGVFGLPHTADEAACVLVPVPFDATTSYRDGTRRGPAAILEASRQVDLFDLQFGRFYERGIHMLEADRRLVEACDRARAAAEPIHAKGGADPSDPDDARLLRVVEEAGDLVNEVVEAATARLLAADRLPGIVGGDHSVPFGAIRAAAEALRPLGLLHVDAHADLRPAYEGFRWSHASILHNVVGELPGVERIVQVGVRDFSEQELRAIHDSDGRVVTWFGLDWRRRLLEGERLGDLLDQVLAPLPERVWVTFDVDGLEPALAPHTGTPVPGGLTFDEACLLLERLARSGRQVIGFDLCEVAPGEAGDEWDAIVGARLLYKLCGAALVTR